MIRVCLHGAESTGKSTLAARLGYPWVPEYGRAYCEAHGTDIAMEDLLAMARGQDLAMRSAAATRPDVLILDTDPLMTAAWARMLFGEVPAALMEYEKADLYLLFAPDVDWVADETRFFGSADERRRFADICKSVLVEAGVPFKQVSGDWNAREALVRAAIRALTDERNAC